MGNKNRIGNVESLMENRTQEMEGTWRLELVISKDKEHLIRLVPVDSS